ncbi:MAG: hypothetical protein RLZ17_440, partial [Actinomycetota bacterium]
MTINSMDSAPAKVKKQRQAFNLQRLLTSIGVSVGLVM